MRFACGSSVVAASICTMVVVIKWEGVTGMLIGAFKSVAPPRGSAHSGRISYHRFVKGGGGLQLVLI